MKRVILTVLIGSLPLRPAQGIQAFTLPNGLRVLLLEDHAIPLVRASLRVDWEPSADPPEREGLGLFLGSLLKHTGPGFQSRAAFDRSVAAAGVRLHFAPGPGRLTWDVAARSTDQEAAMQALARLVMRPSLEGPRVEAMRMNAWRTLEATPPAEKVRNQFLASLQRFTPVEAAALNRISLADLEAFQRTILRPEKAVLGLAGDLNLPQAKALALLHLGAWSPAPARSPLPGTPLPALLSHPEGAPEVWLGSGFSIATPQSLAAAELLARILEALPEVPITRTDRGDIYLLTRTTSPQVEALPAALQDLRTRWEGLSRNLTPAALGLARERWLQEEAVLPLNPGRQLDVNLNRSLDRAPGPEAIQGVTLAEVKALFSASLARPRLLVLGVPKRTLSAWLAESPAFALWAAPQDPTGTPNRDAKSK